MAVFTKEEQIDMTLKLGECFQRGCWQFRNTRNVGYKHPTKRNLVTENEAKIPKNQIA